MHSYGDDAINFYYNGDFSGDVKITVPYDAVKHIAVDKRFAIPSKFEVEIPFSLLKSFVLGYYRSKLMEIVENDDETLEQYLFGKMVNPKVPS